MGLRGASHVPTRMPRRGGNWGLPRRGAAPPDRGGRCPAEPVMALLDRIEHFPQSGGSIRPCILTVSLWRAAWSKYHLNDAETTVGKGPQLHRELPLRHSKNATPPGRAVPACRRPRSTWPVRPR